jgi:hypothetical protein
MRMCAGYHLCDALHHDRDSGPASCRYARPIEAALRTAGSLILSERSGTAATAQTVIASEAAVTLDP